MHSPTLLPEHFPAPPANLADFYDLPRFYSESGGIPALTLHDVATIQPVQPSSERVSCWSVHERVFHGGVNYAGVESFKAHGVEIDFWAMPELSAGHRGGDIPFSNLDAFDSDRTGWRESWIEEVQRDFLPQKMTTSDDEDRSTNVKEGFNPRGTAPPSDQLLCLDTTLFLSFPLKAQAYPDISLGESHR